MKIRALAAYLHERFPLVNMALFAVLFFTVRAVASLACATGRCCGGRWVTGRGGKVVNILN